MLRLIQIVSGSEKCFAEQTIYFGCVKVVGVLFIEFHLLQELKSLGVAFVLYARISQQPERVRFKQERSACPFFAQTFLNLGNAFLKASLLSPRPSAQNVTHG